MTSTAGQPTQPSAPTTSSPAAPSSYASAAGANKKPASSPLIASGTNNTAAVAGNTSSASTAQNGKPVSASPVNGQANRSNVTPAIPASINGSHSRKTSMQPMLIGSGANSIVNGGPVGGSKPQIQFGSPGLGNSSPAPHHIASPAQSPSPIPVPQATGGVRPNTSGAPPQMTFGSFPGENVSLSPFLASSHPINHVVAMLTHRLHRAT
jgi:translation initiation factor 4G